jgi:hypothetical protein
MEAEGELSPESRELMSWRTPVPKMATIWI